MIEASTTVSDNPRFLLGTCERGNLKSIEEGANVCGIDSVGGNALNYACENGFKEIVKLLIDFDIDGGYIHRGISALHSAATTGHTETVSLMLDYGVDAFNVDDSQWCSLHFAGKASTMEIFLNRCLEINSLDLFSNSALHTFCTDLEIVSLLIRRGADLNYRNCHGFTALQLASNCHDVMEVLIDAGATMDESRGVMEESE